MVGSEEHVRCENRGPGVVYKMFSGKLLVKRRKLNADDELIVVLSKRGADDPSLRRCELAEMHPFSTSEPRAPITCF